MYMLVVASRKGGSGKTTLSGHLAVEAERAGAGPVALIDTDVQGSLAQWWNARSSSAPHFVKAGTMELEAALGELEGSGVRLAIIDTPPAITGTISEVVACADLVLIPTRPSPHDLRAVGATVDIAEHHGKPVIFVVNDATARARITGETAVALSQHGTVAPVIVHHRVDFAASMVDGRTVGEAAPGSKSAEEIRALWLYVQDRLSRLRGDPRAKARPAAAHGEPTPESLSAATAVPERPAEADAQKAAIEAAPHAPLPPMDDDEDIDWIDPETQHIVAAPTRARLLTPEEEEERDRLEALVMTLIGAMEMEPEETIPAAEMAEPSAYDGPERRLTERRLAEQSVPQNRRAHGSFGRRRADRFF
jgi:chromosome partitioning protein